MNADLLLLLTAAIWGLAFVAQRVGMTYMGPFIFNAIRFTLGGLSLLPLLVWQNKREERADKRTKKTSLFPLLFTGLILFAGASLQQIGLVGTTAGKAGFITGLYVILVPLLALLWGRKTHPAHWMGALLAVGGLYLLSVKAGFEVSPYDLVVLAGAFVWAEHVHLIDRFAGIVGPIRLSIGQFLVCGVLSLITAIAFEEINLVSISDGIYPILYGAFLSVGLAYTLQVVAQRTADPTHAVVILSLEGAFAALGGWFVLQEVLTPRDLLGSALMLTGVLFSQFLGQPRINPGCKDRKN